MRIILQVDYIANGHLRLHNRLALWLGCGN